MKRPYFPLSVASVLLLSLIYWLYLSQTIRMDIVFDSHDYRFLGRMIYYQGWISYFTTGPNREPLYPLLIALSMIFEHCTGVTFVKIMAIFDVIIMSLTQVLTYKILRLLNIRQGICVLILTYLALSPAFNNSAFSLYSEIATFPFILGIILASFYAWEAIAQSRWQKSILYGALLGLLLTAATFIKAVFECITPTYLIIFFVTVYYCSFRDCFVTLAMTRILPLILCLIAAISFYYVPVTGYKWLNQHYNGNFVITDRASWALYGNTARRIEPLTIKRFEGALASTQGEYYCGILLGPKEGDFWSFRESDVLGHTKLSELKSKHLSLERINANLLRSSVQEAFQHPFQYILLTFVEGLKMFFWERVHSGGFVNFPHWLEKIYAIPRLFNFLCFLVNEVTIIAVVSLWMKVLTPYKSPIPFLIGVLLFLYILFYSFFFILTRYALPIAPLYLISIGLWIEQNLAPKKTI